MPVPVRQLSEAPRPSSLLRERTWFHLVYRLVVRLYEGLMAHSDPVAPSWLTWAASLAAAGDMAEAALLRRTSRFALLPRLAIDATDTALWSVASSHLEDSPVLSGVPLAGEAGIVLGAKGLIVPAVNAAVSGVVRRRCARPLRLAGFGWQVAAVMAGSGLRAYENHWRRIAHERSARDLEARIEEAHLAGQNAVAMSADSAVDLLTRTTPLLALSSDDQLLGGLMIGWKETLAAQTEGIATYLSLALHNWQLRHNDSPDLSADVTVEIRGDQGTVILSRRQATWLAESLELMHLRGTVRVQVADPERARIPNRHIAIVVNGEPMTIPPDPSAALEPFDVGPVVLVAQAAWFLGAAMPGQPESALGAVAIPALGSLSLAAWSFRHKERLGEVAHGPLIVGALGLGILQTALATATMRSPRAPSGLRRFPAAAALIGPCILASLYWSDLTKAYRVAAAALAGSSVLVGYALTPDSLRLTDVISEVIWPASAAASAVRLPMTLRADAARLRASLREAESERLESAFNEGQQLVIRLVSGAHQRAQHALEENRAFLDPKMADEASQRLRQIARQLRAMK